MARIPIRRGESGEAPALAELIAISDDGIMAFLHKGIRRELEIFLESEGRIFSADLMRVAQKDGKIIGLVFAYNRRLVKKTICRTFWSIAKCHGLWGLLRILPLLILISWKTRFGPRDCYISNLAVHPEYRDCGVGRMLIRHIFLLFDCDRIVLDVCKTNRKAIRFYHRLGYRLERVWRFRDKKYFRLYIDVR